MLLPTHINLKRSFVGEQALIRQQVLVPSTGRTAASPYRTYCRFVGGPELGNRKSQCRRPTREGLPLMSSEAQSLDDPTIIIDGTYVQLLKCS